MPRFKFEIGGPEGVRHAGFVQGQRFEDVFAAIGGQFEATHGDYLEIAVAGFPPARYTMMAQSLGGIGGWHPANRQAA